MHLNLIKIYNEENRKVGFNEFILSISLARKRVRILSY